MSFGQRIKSLRQNQQKTQQQIAVKAGIPQTTLSNWELDKTEPVISDARKLAVALGVSLAELIEGKDHQAACLPRTG
jgi:transcriptional regulator with XRE-family HTH domain